MDKLLRHVDLCSGIGGFALGFEWAGLSRPVMFCDIEEWSRQIVSKHWPDVPVATDVKELANDPDGLIPDCDILTAGYPCQPFSLAGERRGSEDDRHIWPYILSIVQRKRPSWCVFENVYGHVSMGLDEVLSDLEGESYAARPFIVPACAADAPHRRDRIWIIARNVGDTKRSRQQGNDRRQSEQEPENGRADVAHAESLHGDVGREHSQQSERQVSEFGDNRGTDNVAYTRSARLQRGKRLRKNQEEVGERRESADGTAPKRGDDGGRKADFWLPEPAVGRVANGIPRRVDRLR
jgi:DNA (cytosine-5)-methyltransferase 1